MHSYFRKSITFTDFSLQYLFDHIRIKSINFSRVHKTFINVLTASSKFQEEKKEERDDVNATTRQIWMLTQCAIHQ